MLRLQKKRFCESYLKHFNAARAAREAGYSEDTDKQIGYNLLQETEVKEYLDRRQIEISEKEDITPEKIAKELAKIGFFDIREIFDDSGSLLPVSEFSDNAAAVVNSVEVYKEDIRAGEETIGTSTTSKVKVSDKRAALETLIKMLGFNSADKVDITSLGKTIANPRYISVKDDAPPLTEEEEG